MAKIVLINKCQDSVQCGSMTLHHFRGLNHGNVMIMSGVDEICGHQSLGEVKVQFLRDVLMYLMC
jgi:hypothetical protein